MRIDTTAKLVYGILFQDDIEFRDYFETMCLDEDKYSSDDISRIFDNLTEDLSPHEFIDSLEYDVKLKHRMFDITSYGEGGGWEGYIVSPMDWDKKNKENRCIKLVEEDVKHINLSGLKISNKVKNRFLRNLSEYKLDISKHKLRWYLCYSLESS